MSNPILADHYARAAELGLARRSRSSVLRFALSDDAAPLPVSLVAFALLLAVGLVLAQLAENMELL